MTIQMDTIGGGDDDDKSKKTDKNKNKNDNDDNDDDDEERELIEPEPSVSYGSLDRDDIGETTVVRMQKQDERVGPFMQFLQAIYALGGLLAPIFIQISFEINNGYAYAFW
eukprot:CAMPEP_0201596272 /NCGR_PEP_ID=MMETSP0190_2-20130828/193009_1 /ASSEMBLY_ACC=CAM_ASM_000263 /TAXON_ID=37353 /ORGANISM="Rosalina sp." /LENGTH=110 /DNA_ID=CAMNT_0048056561 /DNA_START=906 /DNA_END=1235 /DNA_ORIENTATION=-